MRGDVGMSFIKRSGLPPGRASLRFPDAGFHRKPLPQCDDWASEKCLRKSPRTLFVDEPWIWPSVQSCELTRRADALPLAWANCDTPTDFLKPIQFNNSLSFGTRTTSPSLKMTLKKSPSQCLIVKKP